MIRRRAAGVVLAGLALWAAAGCRGVDPWVDINDPEMQWRAKAAAALGAIESAEPERLDDAIALLERRWRNGERGEPAPLVRFAILEAFGELGTPRAVPVVAEGLRDPVPLVREAAVRVAGRLGLTDQRALLIDRLPADESAEVRAAIAGALADLDDPDGEPDLTAVPALIERLDDTAIVSVAAHAALQRLTLQPLERDPAAWRAWWRRWQSAAPAESDGSGDERKRQ